VKKKEGKRKRKNSGQMGRRHKKKNESRPKSGVSEALSLIGRWQEGRISSEKHNVGLKTGDRSRTKPMSPGAGLSFEDGKGDIGG